MKKLFLIWFILTGGVYPQNIIWTEISGSYSLPEGVKLFEGKRTTPALKAWYLEADLSNPDISIRPYITTDIANVRTLNTRFGAIASINGGFFGGSQSYSTVLYPLEVKAINVQSLTRNSKSYPVIRSFFSMKTNRELSVDWIYHFGFGRDEIYSFTQPLPYSENDPTPLPAPQKSEGARMDNLLTGIGGGPRLVKEGQVLITYNGEIFWESGVGLTNPDPRTAVGFTDDGKVIMIVADGRNIGGSQGVSLQELAQIMINLGCTEAMNLDGGGSTQMAVGDQAINAQSSRELPVIFSVVYTDSLNLPKEPVFEKIIDTGDEGVSVTGNDWFESANTGYFGTTRSILNGKGDGSSYVKFNLGLPAPAIYEIYGWWVAASNRCKDTPFIVKNAFGSDTIRLDQTVNGSTWVKIGEFVFSGDSADQAIITDGASNGDYVVADAIRIISFDPNSVVSVDEEETFKGYKLRQNYPNPFNAETVISFTLPKKDLVELKIFDILGEEVASLMNTELPPGEHSLSWNARDISTGVYFLRLKSGGYIRTLKLALVK